MILADDAHYLQLSPVRYQFPTPMGNEFDDNWLIVRGDVTTPGGSWGFADPAMLRFEAEGVPRWLRAVADGRVPVTAADDEDGRVEFLEPVLGFSLAARDERAAVVRVHFALAAAPPWAEEHEQTALPSAVVEIRCTDRMLRAAADEWARELARLPER
ncbi:WapI family immunity protein [Kitasatospora terrestris]|uniref:Uncharacterized protein n=1 Tax=Kitasatospora terrestris TaxID=258051 RepID=A0ABP9EKW9_9ACTN